MRKAISARSAPTPAEGRVDMMVIGWDGALVKHAEYDIDRHRGGEDQPGFAGERAGELGGVARIGAGDRIRHADVVLGLVDGGDGVAQ